MASLEGEHGQISLEAEHVGGIEQTAVTFDPGVTILVGRNATHRTSLLQAIMAGLGSRRASLKGDADEGRVRLTLGDDVYTRRLYSHDGDVAYDGDPYLDDPELADLFAFLLESNEARRTVALGGDLREIIMQPVDAESIQAEIERLEARKRDLDDEIADLESLQSQLPELEEERARLDTEIEEVRETLAEKREQLDDEPPAGTGDDQSPLESTMADLQDARSSLDDVAFKLESQRDSLATLEDELADLERQEANLTEDEHDDLASIESEISRLQEKKGVLDTELTKLQSVIQFNEEMLEGTSQDIAAALRGDDAAVTEQLTETVVCWTCGTEVEGDTIAETLERLRSLRESKYSEQGEIDSRLDDLKQRRSDIQSRQRERDRIEDQIADVRAEIEEREAKIDDLETRREDLQAEIEALEADVERLQNRSETIAAHREINELEIDLERLEDERDRVTSNIEELEARVAELDDLRAQKAQLQSELTDLRTRIDQIEREAVEAFNDHMETVLDILGYANIDRIWVERTEREVREGRRTVSESTFDLHVVRSTDDGVTYEDDFDHLSESEREVTGLIFALAGYLAHEVYEAVPFILLDSLEAIDSNRIAKLVAYMHDYADYLVVALLPEDAAALDDSYERVTDI